MDWITNEIAIGNYQDAANVELLAAEGFQSLLCLDGSHRPDASTIGIDTCDTFDLIDGPGNEAYRFQQAVKRLVELVEDHTVFLVHCHAGRSRSPLVVAGFLIVTKNSQPDVAIAKIGEKREINISSGLEDLLYWL